MFNSESADAGQGFEPKECAELLAEHNAKSDLPKGEFLKFNLGKNASNLCVFNPAVLNREELWARVDEKTDESSSVVRRFVQGSDEIWSFEENSPVFKNSQDPFYCGIVDGFHILGVVKISKVIISAHLGFRTLLYCYKESPSELISTKKGKIIKKDRIIKPFAKGPDGMKDIRIIQRKIGKISVFTRPQEELFGGRGEIGYFEIDNLGQLEAGLANHVLKKDPFSLIPLFKKRPKGENDWGGANALYNLPDGTIGVLGHIANGISHDGIKNYYPMTAIFDPITRSFDKVQIIATAEQFPFIEVEDPTVGSVGFSGTLIPLSKELSCLYTGIANRRIGKIDIPNPF